jgi:peptidoglycan/LPS O-acetylase OafA/YrhL
MPGQLKYIPNIHPHVLSLVTIFLAAILGYLSWSFVEKPFMQLKKKVAIAW